jgi:hypothetical protein
MRLLSTCWSGANANARIQCQFDALKAGRFKTHSNDGSGWKDTTQDSIERVEENIRELSKLIYKYEAARFER